MPNYPPEVERLRKQDVAHRFIEQVGEDGPQGREADKPPVVQAVGDRQAQDETDKQVAGDKHPSWEGCRLAITLRFWVVAHIPHLAGSGAGITSLSWKH